ncbi:putative transferase CAF17 [Paramyrothecium foliicola]|nr:putative transferase CAF17 [Paramyrothecium foliicola]
MRELPVRLSLAPLHRAVVCRSCGFQARGFASSNAPPKPPSAGLAALPSRHLISLSGPDAAKFLQGIVTSNVVAKDGNPRGDPFYTGFLNATGRVLHDVFIYPYQRGPGLPGGSSVDRAYILEVDANQSTTFRQYLKRYKLRSKISLQALSPDDATIWHAWSDEAGKVFDVASDESRIVFADPRAPGLGHRVLQLNNKTPEIDLEQSTEDAYTVRRYLRGVAEGQDEIRREQALPQESNMDMMQGIDWHKGCYVGQELTIRTRHRGVVRKRILPCAVYEKDKAAPLTLSYEPDSDSPEALSASMIPTETSIGRHGKKGRSAGKWLKGVGNIGLALCRLETMTDVSLPGEQAAQSFSPDSEFIMEWGEQENKSALKIKAFVPDWLRQSLNQS